MNSAHERSCRQWRLGIPLLSRPAAPHGGAISLIDERAHGDLGLWPALQEVSTMEKKPRGSVRYRFSHVETPSL